MDQACASRVATLLEVYMLFLPLLWSARPTALAAIGRLKLYIASKHFLAFPTFVFSLPLLHAISSAQQHLIYTLVLAKNTLRMSILRRLQNLDVILGITIDG